MKFGSEGHSYIIAEAGVNHNGSLETARELVRAAKKAGADAVKFQTFKAERVALADAPKAAYQLRNTDQTESQIEMLRKLELSEDAHRELLALCGELDIDFLSTPYNEEDVDFLSGLGVSAFKLASIHVVEPHFLRYVARTRKHMIVSTGMATLDEVEQAVRALREAKADFTLLQCTTNYPSRIGDANLRAMVTMRETFQCRAGYSDHTQTDITCIAAIALGAVMIEKHFTLDQSLLGPDHSSAATPEQFASLCEKIRATEAALGSGRKEPSEAESVNLQNMRRSLTTRRSIAAGVQITEEMLTCKRPASGISPLRIGEVTGRVAAMEIPAGTALTWAMLR